MRGDGRATGGVAERAHELDVARRVDELELLDGRGARRNEVRVLDQASFLDELDRELDADGLQRVRVREVVLHQRFAVHERDRPGHGNLR